MKVARTETMVTLLLQAVHMLEIQLAVASKKHFSQEFTLRLHFLLHTSTDSIPLILNCLLWLYPAVLAQQEFFRDKAYILLYLRQIFHPRVKAIFIDRGNMAAESSNITHTGRLKWEATNTCLVLLQGLVTVTLILWFKTKQWEIAVHKHNTDKQPSHERRANPLIKKDTSKCYEVIF